MNQKPSVGRIVQVYRVSKRRPDNAEPPVNAAIVIDTYEDEHLVDLFVFPGVDLMDGRRTRVRHEDSPDSAEHALVWRWPPKV